MQCIAQGEPELCRSGERKHGICTSVVSKTLDISHVDCKILSAKSTHARSRTFLLQNHGTKNWDLAPIGSGVGSRRGLGMECA